jgi:hypothetical protein
MARNPNRSHRPTLTVRFEAPLYETIKKAAAEHGKSMSEEIEDRVASTITLEAERAELAKARAEIDRLFATAREAAGRADQIVMASRIAALRAAGFAIVRETDGSPTRVTISIDQAEAEAEAYWRRPVDLTLRGVEFETTLNRLLDERGAALEQFEARDPEARSKSNVLAADVEDLKMKILQLQNMIVDLIREAKAKKGDDAA